MYALDLQFGPEAPNVSRRHCKLVWRADRTNASNSTFHASDLRSTHGSFLNGERLPDDSRERPIRHGDVLWLGRACCVRYSAHGVEGLDDALRRPQPPAEQKAHKRVRSDDGRPPAASASADAVTFDTCEHDDDATGERAPSAAMGPPAHERAASARAETHGDGLRHRSAERPHAGRATAGSSLGERARGWRIDSVLGMDAEQAGEQLPLTTVDAMSEELSRTRRRVGAIDALLRDPPGDEVQWIDQVAECLARYHGYVRAVAAKLSARDDEPMAFCAPRPTSSSGPGAAGPASTEEQERKHARVERKVEALRGMIEDALDTVATHQARLGESGEM